VHTSTKLAQTEEAIQQYRDSRAIRSVRSLFYQQEQKIIMFVNRESIAMYQKANENTSTGKSWQPTW
jgi:hypothetical protein